METNPSPVKPPYAAKITGTGSAFPEQRVTNFDLAKTMDTSDEWIRERTGIIERRLSKPGDPNDFNTSFAYRASMKALEMAGKRPEDVDHILYATVSPDTYVPNAACRLQHKLGALNAAAVDINFACSGFVYGLTVANQFISSGFAKTALVVGSEKLSAITNWDDRSSCILFGDGGGAVVVERTSPDSPHRILSTHLRCDGNYWELFQMPAGGSSLPITHELLDQKLHLMNMRGTEIFKVAVKTLADFAVKAIEANGFTAADVDWFIPHQANLRIIEAVAKRLNFPMEKVLVNIDRYGNTSSASVPTTMDEAVRDGRIKPGHLILMDVFGAGLTFGSALLRW